MPTKFLPPVYEAVFKASPIGSYLLSATPEVTVLDVNESFLETVSLMREQMVGRSLFEVFPANPLDLKDTGVEALRQSIAQAVATGQTQLMPAQRYPVASTLPSGEVVFEERFWSAANTPIQDAQGQVVCVYHTTMDITKQVRAEAALRESEERYRLALDASGNIGTWAVDPETNVTVMDGTFAELFAVDPAVANEGAEITHFTERIHAEDRPSVLEAVGRAIATGDRYDIDYRIVQPSGKVVWVTAKGKMFQDAESGKKRFAGVAVDITSRKAIEQKLQDDDRRKDEFLAMLAHELRNPLAPIRAAAKLLLLGKPDEERLRQTSEIIDRQVRHMTGLVDDLLDVSRVTQGLIDLDSAPLDIGHAVAAAVEQARPMIVSRGHRLVVEMTPEVPLVLGDKKRLVQIVANLLVNAAKFTNEGGEIQVKTEAVGSQVLIHVVDNGIGMSSELVASAFDLFTQGERSSDRSSGGLGLGLALVKSIVELHGGTVECKSAGVGKGSAFTLRVPRLSAGAAVTPVLEPAIPNAGAGSLRIMIVDDNVDAALTLSMLLEALGYEVLVEHRPQRAIEHAKTALPQVFLLDIGLPEMDGYELAKRLRAQRETANAVLIAVTGYGQESDRSQSLSTGFDHHLVKPVDPEHLMAILADIANVKSVLRS